MSVPRKSHRRDFLKGNAAARAVEDIVDRMAPAELSDPSSAGSSGYLLHFSRRAMACRFQVMLDAAKYRQAADAAIEALDLIDALEAQMTVYRDDSAPPRCRALRRDRRGLRHHIGAAFEALGIQSTGRARAERRGIGPGVGMHRHSAPTARRGAVERRL